MDKNILKNITLFLVIKTALYNDKYPVTYTDIKEIEEIYDIKISEEDYLDICNRARCYFGHLIFDLNGGYDYDKDSYEDSKDFCLSLCEEFQIKGKQRDYFIKMLKKENK